MKFSLAIFSAVCLTIPPAFAAPRDTAFAEASAAFEAGKFAEAERGFRQLVDDGALSEFLFLNLGNSLFRLGKPGEAALWFQRCRVFSPRMAEANQNLTFLQKTYGYLEIERTPLEEFIFKRRPAELTWFGFLGGWIFLLALALAFFVRRLRDWRPLLIIVSLFGLALAIGAWWAGKKRAETLAPELVAIVVEGGISALTAPAPRSAEVIALPPGSEVRVVTERGPWTYIDIPGNLRGWVSTDAIQKIWPITAQP